MCRSRESRPWPIRKVLPWDSRSFGGTSPSRRRRPRASSSGRSTSLETRRKRSSFYKRLAGYESTISESRLGVEYHVLRKARSYGGLFQIPATADVRPNWLPYVLVDDPATISARVVSLGGRILVPAAPERRNGSLVVIADPGGAPLALQKYPF